MSQPAPASERPAGDSVPPYAPERSDQVRFRRGDVYSRPVVDGRELADNGLARVGRWLKSAATSNAEREEAELARKLADTPRITRANTVAVVSPKGGVGKTTCTFLLGNLLASHLRLRALAVDANRDFGTLAALAPDGVRVHHSLADLIAVMDRLRSASEIAPYVSPLPSGLHVLAAPERPEVMADMTPELYGTLLAFLSRYYDVILLDLGTGIVDPLAQFGLQRSDQALVVTTPEFVTAEKVLGALRYLSADEASNGARPEAGDRLTVLLNHAPGARSSERQVIEGAFRRVGVSRHVAIPRDDRLRVMLDSSTYSLGALDRRTRLPIQRLGLAVAERLV